MLNPDRRPRSREGVAKRLRGERSESIRDSDGPRNFIDVLLAEVEPEPRLRIREVLAIALSIVCLLTFPIAGLAGGLWLTWPQPIREAHCGMYELAMFTVTAIGTSLGLAAGIGVGIASAAGLSALVERPSRRLT